METGMRANLKLICVQIWFPGSFKETLLFRSLSRAVPE